MSINDFRPRFSSLPWASGAQFVVKFVNRSLDVKLKGGVCSTKSGRQFFMDQQIERILSQVPGWSGAEAVVTPLLGGITNQNYRVDIASETFVLRIGGKGTHLLGIDRARERTCTAIAAQMGVGAEVVHFLASESDEVLVTRFIPGEGISPETAARPEMLQRIVDAIRCYHAGPDFPGAFTPFETVRSYHKLALEHNVAFPGTLPQVFNLMAQIEV